MNIRGYEIEDVLVECGEQLFPGFVDRIVDIRPCSRNIRSANKLIIELDDGTEILDAGHGTISYTDKTVKRNWYNNFGGNFSYWFDECFPDEYYDACNDDRKIEIIHRRTGVPKARLNKFLTGSDIPTSYELCELASFFLCTPNDLLGITR